MQSKRSGTSRAGGVGTTLSLVLLATLLIAAVALFSFQSLQPDIERDLTARVTTALQGQVNGISIDGQDVILTGAVSSEAASKRAAEAAESVYGVSRVINNLTFDGSTQDAADSQVAVVDTENSGADQSSPNESGTKVSDNATDTTPLVLDNDQTTTAPPTLTIASRDGKISIQGIVPDEETIERVNAALTGKFGRGNVRNELSSFAGSFSPQWLGGMLSMIDQLDGIKDPILKVTGQDVILGGTVTAEQIRRAKVATAQRLLGAELNLIDNLNVVAPTSTPEPEVTEVSEADKSEEPDSTVDDPVNADADNDAPETQAVEVTVAAITPQTNSAPSVVKRPASIEINSSNNQIKLSGFVASEKDASDIRQGLDNLFGVDGYFDELEISDSVESADWIDDALIVTSEIRDVPEFIVNILAGQMSLSGSVTDRETARDLSIAATEIAGDKLGVLNNFSINRSADSSEDLMALSLLQELEALPTDKIVFTKNSTTLAESAKEVLDDVAAAILGYNDLVVEIAGHTDSSGDAVTNLRLSKQRATAVQDYLVEKNVPDSRLSPIGYGETAPISDNDTVAGRAANRRIEFNL